MLTPAMLMVYISLFMFLVCVGGMLWSEAKDWNWSATAFITGGFLALFMVIGFGIGALE